MNIYVWKAQNFIKPTPVHLFSAVENQSLLEGRVGVSGTGNVSQPEERRDLNATSSVEKAKPKKRGRLLQINGGRSLEPLLSQSSDLKGVVCQDGPGPSQSWKTFLFSFFFFNRRMDENPSNNNWKTLGWLQKAWCLPKHQAWVLLDTDQDCRPFSFPPFVFDMKGICHL